MRKTTLFIAMSLDGYIADAKGGADWLDGQDPDQSPRIFMPNSSKRRIRF